MRLLDALVKRQVDSPLDGAENEVGRFAVSDNVRPLRPVDPIDPPDLVCACGERWWIATVTIDRDTLRPTGIDDQTPTNQPVLRCRACARGYPRG